MTPPPDPIVPGDSVPSLPFYSEATATPYVLKVVRKPSLWRLHGRNVLLFVLTALSVFWTELYLVSGSYAKGLRLVVAVMSIMTAHEMGHYLACRYYRIRATLPFFIPAPFLNPLVGTLGAVIVIRSPFPHRKALFDVGIAGPIAGFVVCTVVLVLGVFEARPYVPTGSAAGTVWFGDPLILQWAFAWLRQDLRGPVEFGPLAMAAWFGLLMTALNLVPIGQFDGGHILYSVFPRHARRIGRIVWWCCVALTILSPSWVLWVILLRVLGRPHPPTLDDSQPLGRGRTLLALVAVGIFAVSFLPSPTLLSWADLIRTILELFGWS